MTKQDFCLIATIISTLEDSVLNPTNPQSETLRKYVAQSFAQSLQRTNPRFNYDEFLKVAIGT